MKAGISHEMVFCFMCSFTLTNAFWLFRKRTYKSNAFLLVSFKVSKLVVLASQVSKSKRVQPRLIIELKSSGTLPVSKKNK
jgi:hypothetical protein